MGWPYILGMNHSDSEGDIGNRADWLTAVSQTKGFMAELAIIIHQSRS